MNAKFIMKTFKNENNSNYEKTLSQKYSLKSSKLIFQKRYQSLLGPLNLTTFVALFPRN